VTSRENRSLGYALTPAPYSCPPLGQQASERTRQGDEKGPAARRRPRAAREAYFLYVERAVEGGGRFQCELTDVDPAAVKIGDRVGMTFRRLFTANRVHNYFWKARPLA